MATPAARFTERAAPLTAALTALAAFACCVPLGLAGAVGIVSASALFEAAQPWLPTVAALVHGLGVVHAYRRQKTCRRALSRFSLVVLGLSAAVTLGVLLFPQIVARLIADYLL